VSLLLLAPFLAPAVAFDAEATAAAARRDRIEADLRVLTGHELTAAGAEPLVSRSVYHPDSDRAADWLVEAMAAIEGLQVRTETFEAVGQTGLRNVIGELVGAEPERPAVVLAAHYDSTAELDPDPWEAAVDPAPGADDDASGISAVLEAARLLSAEPGGFSRTLRFVLFSAEEVGLVGSTYRVEQLQATGARVALALVLDPVGYDPGDGGILWFSYDQRWSDAAESLEAAAPDLAPELLVLGVDHETFGGDDRSDHFPYWQAGLPALHLGTFPQPPTYHTRADDLDVVDVDFVTAVSGFVAGHAGNLAGPPPQDEQASLLGCAAPPPGPTGAWVLIAGLLLVPCLTSSRGESRRDRRRWQGAATPSWPSHVKEPERSQRRRGQANRPRTCETGD